MLNRWNRRAMLGTLAGTGIAAATGMRADSQSVAAPYHDVPYQANAPSDDVYFPATGHHVPRVFFDYWRAHGRDMVLGLPLTEPFGDRMMQYFTNARLEHWPEVPEQVQPGLLGQELFEQGGRDTTPRPVQGKFGWYAGKPNIDLGPAISDIEVAGRPLQYTQRACLVDTDNMPSFYAGLRDKYNLRLLWPGEIRLTNMGRVLAERSGADMNAVDARPGAAIYRPDMFDRTKRIDVALTSQVLTAHEGGLPVYRAPISGGARGFETITGNFRVLQKIDIMNYSSPFPNRPYFIPHVPYNLQFYGGFFIHGAYWHDEFAETPLYGRSAGCVNLNLDDAGFMYFWAPVGTPVDVHY